MIDIHCHILPNIDDGADSFETAIAMAEIAQKKGTKSIVATPHVIEGDWLPAWEDIVSRCQTLSNVLKDKDINISVCPGAEVAMNMDIIELVDGPGHYCINSGRYMLVELPAAEIPSYAEEFFFMLQTKGISPILAHPERHPSLIKKPELLVDWINKGILLQVNGLSFSGRMGNKVKETAEMLLTNNMIHAIGSDAHSARTRNTDLSQAAAVINDLVGQSQVQRLFVDNPALIISSQEVKTEQHHGILKSSNSPGFFKRVISLFA